jgi:hypothetical protein
MTERVQLTVAGAAASVSRITVRKRIIRSQRIAAGGGVV